MRTAWTTAHVLGVAAALLLALSVAGCSGGDDDGTDVAPDTTEATTSTSPAPSDASLEVLAALDGTALGTWVDALGAVTADGDPCADAPPPMDATIFDAAAGLADPLLAELLLNADAAAVTARDACEAGEAELAGTEWADAVATSAQIRERLAEHGYQS